MKKVASPQARVSQSPTHMLPGTSHGPDKVIDHQLDACPVSLPGVSLVFGPSLDKTLEEGELPPHPSPKALVPDTEVGEI